ncbi:MAG: serpin family protein [bacterium]
MNIIILTVTLFVSASRAAEKGVPDARLVLTKNEFGFKVLGALVPSSPDENVFISPYSIATALSMTYNGAGGETRTAMAKVLGVADIELERLNTGERLLAELLKKDKSGVELLIANSLWARNGIVFNPGFLKTNKEFYKAEVATLDFNSPYAANKINNWVKDKTKGKIDKIVDQIKPEAVLFLINAVYFKGRWQEKFDPKNTQEDNFYLENESPVPVQMMVRSGKFRYLETAEFQAVELPYGDGKMSMLIFLPAVGVKLDSLISRLSSATWQEWWNRFRSRQGAVHLPRFKITYEKSLKEVLVKLGMGIAFDLNRADFSLMGKNRPGFAIGDVKHKSFVEVNEEGTEAAAVTSVEMVLAAVPEGRFEMVVNRPFLFAIQDNENGAIVFLGVVKSPEKDN